MTMPSGAEDRPQPGETLQAGVGAGPSSVSTLALALDRNRDDLVVEPAGLDGGDGALVGAQGERVELLAGDPVQRWATSSAVSRHRQGRAVRVRSAGW